jgi:hypothetical protein
VAHGFLRRKRVGDQQEAGEQCGGETERGKRLVQRQVDQHALDEGLGG